MARGSGSDCFFVCTSEKKKARGVVGVGVGVFSPAAAPQEALSAAVELTLCSAVELDGASQTKLTRQSEPKNPSWNRVG